MNETDKCISMLVNVQPTLANVAQVQSAPTLQVPEN